MTESKLDIDAVYCGILAGVSSLVVGTAGTFIGITSIFGKVAASPNATGLVIAAAFMAVSAVGIRESVGYFQSARNISLDHE
jgi:hypothetical protein